MAIDRKVLLASTLISLLAFAGPVSRADDSHARMVRISYVEGDVHLNHQNITMNAPIVEGSVLATSTDSLVEVEFEDGSTVRLAPESQITFSQLARLTSGDAITRVDLDQGEAEFYVAKPTAGFLSVDVHSKNILFKQAGRYRILSTNYSPLELGVWKGSAAVHDHDTGEEVDVQRNETFTLDAADPQEYDLEGNVVADELDRWSQSRDKFLAGNYVTNGNGNTPSILPTSGFIGYGFGGVCQPNYWSSYYFYPGAPYWFSAAPGLCFSTLFFFPPPYYYGYIYPPITPLPRRRPPTIHPPVPPVAAAAPKLGAASVSVRQNALGNRVVPRMFDEDNFKRSPSLLTEEEVRASETSTKDPKTTGVEVRGQKASENHVSSGGSGHVAHAGSNHSSSSGSSGMASSHPSSFSGSGSRGFSGSSPSFSQGSSSFGSSSHSSSGSSGGRGK